MVTADPQPKGVNEWLIKWRGKFDEPGIPNALKSKCGPTDVMTTSMTFKRGEEGKLVLPFIFSCTAWRTTQGKLSESFSSPVVKLLTISEYEKVSGSE